ncbi:hypothetical protein CHS0354_003362 [Potamilus streckersoni]|uniref:M-phase inducer phosphatase n=1 Tax=Potamilus streckersoni TaxID=2493646 RepID=A0AAE0VP81_9BIVA|nr:hypothetical protein CHS0354_003362 [Potamilus streckersoni]
MKTPIICLGSEMNNSIPVPTITPEKWVTMGPTGSWQKKGLPSINTSTLDEDSGLGMDVDQGFTLTTPHLGLPIREDNMDDSLTELRHQSEKCSQTVYTRRRLLNIKRSLYHDEIVSSKRSRNENSSPKSLSVTILANPSPSSDHASAILDAVNRISLESDLIADGSKPYSLPTIPSKHKDLRCITVDTMAAVLRGDYSGIFRNCTIIDCRYPYEFEGGHIEGAVNVYTKGMMQQFLHQAFYGSYNAKRNILIFHCEFSSKRGPKMYRFLREQDRILNKTKYPHLFYPEVYLLEGGYKAFYENHKHYCEPMDYKPMLHQDHGDELRHFKTKSKSWTAGDQAPDNLRHKLDF